MPGSRRVRAPLDPLVVLRRTARTPTDMIFSAEKSIGTLMTGNLVIWNCAQKTSPPATRPRSGKVRQSCRRYKTINQCRRTVDTTDTGGGSYGVLRMSEWVRVPQSGGTGAAIGGCLIWGAYRRARTPCVPLSGHPPAFPGMHGVHALLFPKARFGPSCGGGRAGLRVGP